MDLLIDIGMWITYGLAVIAIVVLLYFAVMQVIQNPKRAKTSLFGILGLIVALVIAYFLSSASDLGPEILEKTKTTEVTSKLIGAGLITTYILFGAMLITLIYVEIAKMFKK